MGVTQYPAAVIDRTAQTLGYVERLTDFSVASGDVDIPELTITVTVPAGRRLRLTATAIMTTTGNYYNVGIRIKEGTTKLAEDTVSTETGGDAVGLTAMAIVTPTAGTHTYKVSGFTKLGGAFVVRGTTAPAFLLAEDITGSNTAAPPTSVPVGVLAQAIKTTNQTGFPTSPWTDVAGLSVNVAVPAGRVLRISAHALLRQRTSAGVVILMIKQGDTRIGEDAIDASTDQYVSPNPSVIVSPAAGSHTFKVAVTTTANTVDLEASVEIPAHIIVEDITPTPAPATGSPSSTLGYAEVTADQTGITSEVALTGLSVTVTVPAGRRLRISAKANMRSTVDNDNAALFIKEGSTYLTNAVQELSNAGATTLYTEEILTPTAGTHIYSLAGSRTLGTGTIDLKAHTSQKAFILVEDITAALAYGITSLPASQITAGTFGAGNYAFTGQITSGGFFAEGTTATNVDGLGVKKTGALSATNIYFAASHRANNTDLLFYGYDGTTFKNFIQFNYASDSIWLMQATAVTNGFLTCGSAAMHTWRTNTAYATFGHSGRSNGSSDYSFLSQDSGATYVNATAAGLVRLRIDNSDKATIDASGIDAVGGRVKSTEGHFGTIRNNAANGAATIICINNGNGWRPQWDGTLRFYIESTNVKNFIIPHPVTPDEKYLIHTTLEGPENAVFYRGVGELVNGKVTIKLPSYFEALCAEDGRSVQLTCIADDAEDEWCPVLHATYPTNGEFHVGLGSGMAIPDQRFWWEVKAIRKDVEPLLVEPGVGDIDVMGQGPYTYYKRKAGKRAPTVLVTQKVWPDKIIKPERPRAGRHPDHPEVKEGPDE